MQSNTSTNSLSTNKTLRIGFLDFLTFGANTDISEFEKLGEVVTYSTTEPSLVTDRIRDLDVVITNKVPVSGEVIRSCPRLKLICVAATGMDRIDLATAKELGVVVRNVAGYSTHGVAQHTFALLFSLLGAIPYYDTYCKQGGWSTSPVFTHIAAPFFWEIRGKRWGIIGLGTIGKEVARLAECFGCKVCYYSTSGNNTDSELERLGLEDLLENSDIVSIHAPLNDKTLNLLRRQELSLLKRGAVLLNLGRGAIIDELALARALDEQEVMVGLDVLVEEPMRVDSPLAAIKHPERLLITPHVAWTSIEARKTLLDTLAQHIREAVGESLFDGISA